MTLSELTAVVEEIEALTSALETLAAQYGLHPDLADARDRLVRVCRVLHWQYWQRQDGAAPPWTETVH